VQIARTIYKAKDPANDGFSYAKSGDRTVLNTILAAIRSAKEYIYIEDQYFTPTPDYKEALELAIDNGLKSLVIVIAANAGQVFSESFRGEYINHLLSKNDPLNPVVRIGYPRRGYTLPSTTAENLAGRMKLGSDFSETDTEIVLGPISRVPEAPFWLSVNGEIMLVTGQTAAGIEVPETEEEEGSEDDETFIRYQHYFVERGKDTNFFHEEIGYNKKKHKAGDAATAIVYNSIYVHAKCMMVDDIFASIGSANLSRRGFHSDTETNVFVIPDSLRFDPSNPVALLRKEL